MKIIKQYKNIIIEIFKNTPNNKLNWKLKKYPKLLEDISNICKEYKFFIKPTLFLQVCLNRRKINYCKICNNPIPLDKGINTCSKECHAKYLKTNEVINKRLEKIKNTCLIKYGTNYTFQSNIIKEKIKNTCKEKYGVEYITQSNIMKNKSKETCLEKYNTEQYLSSKDKLEKSKITCLKKYGVENPSQNNEIKIKKKLTFNNNFSNIENKNLLVNKRKETNRKIYNEFNSKEEYLKWQRILNLEEATLLSNKEEFFKDRFNYFNWKCNYCGKIFKSKYNNGNLYSKCKCQKLNEKYSYKEKELLNFCKQYFKNILENDYTLIFPKELDIVIPEIKLAIEFNGIKYHDISIKESNYHLNKTLSCENKGYRLIHIWENDWDNNKNEIKRKLINIFKNKEIIDCNKLLDRDWYQLNQINGYKLQIFPPKIINRGNYKCENTGYLKYIKND